MTLVEIEKSSIILPAMVYRTPIWCFVVYEIGKCDVDWMDEGKLGRTIVRVGSLTINNIDTVQYVQPHLVEPYESPEYQPLYATLTDAGGFDKEDNPEFRWNSALSYMEAK
jgi:hypothetical protein